ncbi:MAG TPA: HhH-GPD-type base excision DNA repair protein [Acidimicrobiales bacterium]|nr:HhH-GPD-type base excision DNA repair protein [Acidimicrobiales bacterium]
MSLYLSGDAAADELLSTDPLALLIGMVLDQQIPLEKAFRSPFDLQERLGGTLDAASLASMDPDKLAAIFAERPALHRFPRSMAGRVQELCALIVDSYDGDAAAIWTSAADGRELLANVKALPGFGEQKARIFVALLGKQLDVRPPGWEKASGPFGEAGSFRSVADIDSAETLAKVRQYKQKMKARAKGKAATGR